MLMIVSFIAAAACVFTAFSALAFVARYSRQAWRKTRVGKNLMRLSNAAGATATLSAGIWVTIGLGDTSHLGWLAVVITVAWLAMGCGFLARSADLREAISQNAGGGS